jgi:hypothetical protein
MLGPRGRSHDTDGGLPSIATLRSTELSLPAESVAATCRSWKPSATGSVIRMVPAFTAPQGTLKVKSQVRLSTRR